MKCKDSKLLISLLCDGQLDDARRATLDAHLKECGECRAEAKLHYEAMAELESFESIEPKEGGWERLMPKVNDAKPARRSLVPAFGFAVIILIAVVTMLALHSASKQRIAVTPHKQNTVKIVKKTLKSPSSIGSTIPNPKNEDQLTATLGTSDKQTPKPNIKRTVKKHQPKPRIRHKIIQPEKNPAPVEEQYIAESATQQPDTISHDADQLIARGFSVLVEASAVQESNERGDNL